MSIENKLKNHINYIYDCNKDETLDYCFTKFYEYENNDEELANYFFKMIGEIILGIYHKPLLEIPIIKATDMEKKMIIDAAYEFSYGNNNGLQKPLENAFVELIDESVEEPFIVPYMNLIKIMQRNRDKVSKNVI